MKKVAPRRPAKKAGKKRKAAPQKPAKKAARKAAKKPRRSEGGTGSTGVRMTGSTGVRPI
jgi:hypothetical protein